MYCRYNALFFPPSFWWSTSLGTYIQQHCPAKWPQEGRAGVGGVEGETSSSVDKELDKQSHVRCLFNRGICVNFLWALKAQLRWRRCVQYTVQMNPIQLKRVRFSNVIHLMFTYEHCMKASSGLEAFHARTSLGFITINTRSPLPVIVWLGL